MQKRDNDQCPNAGLDRAEKSQTQAHRSVSFLYQHLENSWVLSHFLAVSTKNSDSSSGSNLDMPYLKCIPSAFQLFYVTLLGTALTESVKPQSLTLAEGLSPFCVFVFQWVLALFFSGCLGFVFSLFNLYFCYFLKPFRWIFAYANASFPKLTSPEIIGHAKKHLMAHRTGMPQFKEVFNKEADIAGNPFNPLWSKHFKVSR